jgi:hypothetical protein
MQVYGDTAREQLLDDMRKIARGDPELARSEAEDGWREARFQNNLWMLGMFILTSFGAALCFVSSLQFIGGAILVGALGIGIFFHRKKHRAAFVARELAYGATIEDANRLYEQKYD